MSLETMTKLFSTTVGVGGTASITFSNIPQGYTDLCLKVSIRTNRTGAVDDVLQIQPNGSSSNLTTINLRGNGSGAASGSNTTWSGGYVACNGATSNTFGNLEVYFSNYSGFNYKYWSVDAVNENNATESYAELKSVLWSQNSPISSLTLVPLYGTSFNQHSTATLYGIKNAVKTAGNSIKATGGNIVFDGTYVYHVFNTTGAFVPTSTFLAEALVVAGGGGGAGYQTGGGGGAGGVVYISPFSVSPSASYAATIGSGGTGGNGATSAGSSGSDSAFSTATAVGGGGAGYGGTSGGTNGTAGGSGGGAGGVYGTSTSRTGGSATQTSGTGYTGYGFAGGTTNVSLNQGGAGGGGAGGAGANNSGTNGRIGGAGGVGLATWSSWGVATGQGQNVNGTYYFGGGGGGRGGDSSGAGGYGGGGTAAASGLGACGTVATGGGGGAIQTGDNTSNINNGGSGIVIVRYKG